MKAPNADAPGSPYQKLLQLLWHDTTQGGTLGPLEDAHPHHVAIDQFIHLLHRLDSDGDLVSNS